MKYVDLMAPVVQEPVQVGSGQASARDRNLQFRSPPLPVYPLRETLRRYIRIPHFGNCTVFVIEKETQKSLNWSCLISYCDFAILPHHHLGETKILMSIF